MKFFLPLVHIESLVIALLLAGAPLMVRAHGYVELPESRAYLCKTHANSGCGAVQREPQSVEGPKGFPAAGPADGTIAGGGLAQFTELNAQTSTRWKRSDVASGQNKFVWYFTAGHQTQDWRYYLTRQGWHQGEPLSRSAFDAQPFCIANGGFRPSSGTRVTHTCDIPINRSGYHVILATWDIADTGNAFYQVIDVNIRSDAAVNSLKVQINPFSAVQPKQQR